MRSDIIAFADDLTNSLYPHQVHVPCPHDTGDWIDLLQFCLQPKVRVWAERSRARDGAARMRVCFALEQHAREFEALFGGDAAAAAAPAASDRQRADDKADRLRPSLAEAH